MYSFFCGFCFNLFEQRQFDNVYILIYFGDSCLFKLCFKFVKTCIALCNAVNSACRLMQVHVLFTNTRICWLYNELEICHTAPSFASCSIQMSRSLGDQRVRLFANKTCNCISLLSIE